MKYYAGIGSRETPDDILELMGSIARGLYFQGYILRSGGAPGADQAFEWGLAHSGNSTKHIQKHAEIFLPWPKFEEKNRSWIKPCLTEPGPGAEKIAAEYHPRYKYLSHGAKKLIARNTHQIFGPFLADTTFSEFVICWTKGAKGGGGTGQAIRIANGHHVPVYDLADPQQLFELRIRLDGSLVI